MMLVYSQPPGTVDLLAAPHGLVPASRQKDGPRVVEPGGSRCRHHLLALEQPSPQQKMASGQDGEPIVQSTGNTLKENP